MFSRVWALPRTTYQRALQLLDGPTSASFEAQGRAARRDELVRRLAVLDALEGNVPQARVRLGAQAPTEDTVLLKLLGATAHEELFNDEVALELIRQASALVPRDPSILSNLAEVYLSLSQFSETTSTAAKLDPRRVSPGLQVALAALVWTAARLTHAREHEPAQRLVRAYEALPDSASIEWTWTGTKHALTYGRYSAEESQPVLDVLALLEEDVSKESRAKLRTLLAPPGVRSTSP